MKRGTLGLLPRFPSSDRLTDPQQIVDDGDDENRSKKPTYAAQGGGGKSWRSVKTGLAWPL